MNPTLKFLFVIIFVALAYGFYTHLDGLWRILGAGIFLGLLVLTLSTIEKR